MQYELDPPSVAVDTSEMAAASIKPRVAGLRAAVLRRLRFVPQTCDELEEATGLAHQTVGPRLGELQFMGLIERRDEKRPTRSGRMARVWAITQAGLAKLDLAQGLQDV